MFYNEKRIAAMFGGGYICDRCGARMEFEDENEETLICPECGYEMDPDRYGYTDEEYEALYPTEDEVMGYSDDEEDEETYEEVYGELDDD